ncbi:flavodoxin family protein [Methanoregula sp.]|uniref:flavodoxin family protein n=1 Tax=Methanoregula sp. TaxID=2052170 RepID=UPI00236E7340|nr:flavodoxin family protein [Methanoregula sp.]MDD1687098.1 flavodoxin family protein [Methanoregula sp.]
MSQRVLILSASPRKGGNSDLLCDQFMKGAIEAGNQAEKIHVPDKNINFCTGCLTCQSNGGECVHDDDMGEILEKMIRADVLVLATPVYFYNMDAQMKVLIDRTCPRYTEISNKKVYLIATSTDTGPGAMEGTINGFRAALSCYPHAEVAGIICGKGVTNAGDIRGKPEMARAYEMGKSV